MKEFIAIIGGLVIVALVLAVIFVGGGFLGLWWYPYQIKMQTAIVKNSNSYITTQLDGINELMFNYTKTSDPAQKNAIAQQICSLNNDMDAPQYLSPSEASFVSLNCP